MSGVYSGGLAQSVKQRLLNLSETRDETFNVLLLRYGIERLLESVRTGERAPGHWPPGGPWS